MVTVSVQVRPPVDGDMLMVRLRLPVNPLIWDTVIIDWATMPAFTAMVVGLDVIAKSGTPTL